MSTNDIEHVDDPYAPPDEDSQSFVKVTEGDMDDFVELPAESDNTILLSTLQGQFPNAVGMRYKTSSGAWRGVRIAEGALNPPSGGWGETTYSITLQKESGKRKISEETNDVPEAKSAKHEDDDDKSAKPSDKPSDKHLLQDMIVFGLPFKCQDKDLKEYFTSACGEMALHEVKFDRLTKKARGFGFIRFKTVEGAKKALTGEHSIMGRQVEIRLSKRKEEPMKIFIGRIPEGTTQEELKEHFAEFGEVSDAYIPTPFRGFGFVTFTCSDDGRAVLRRQHKMGDARLNVQYAEPKEEKMARRRREEERSYEDSRRGSSRPIPSEIFRQDPRDSRETRDYRERYYPQHESRYEHSNSQHGRMDPRDTAELKNMLYSILSSNY